MGRPAEGRREAGYQLKYLEKTGLVIKREDDQGQDTGRRYDRFRGRVMFPIHNVSGRVVGFGARTLKRDDKMAKYLNSPESEIYHKSDVLYGLFQARQSIRQEELCYLVEGYLDVLSLHQGGIKNVVASSGTSLTEGQIRLIKRYADNVTVLYDGDAAGIKASLRGIDLLLEGGLNVRVVLFPDGDDPDSYIRKVGDQRFAEYIEGQSQDFIAFKTTLVAREASQDPVKKAEAIREVLQSIAKVPDGLKRQVFLQQTASVFGFEEQVIITEYNKLLKSGSPVKARPEEGVGAPLPPALPPRHGQPPPHARGGDGDGHVRGHPRLGGGKIPARRPHRRPRRAGPAPRRAPTVRAGRAAPASALRPPRSAARRDGGALFTESIGGYALAHAALRPAVGRVPRRFSTRPIARPAPAGPP
ncbi:MAG: toprim domain-containing protein [Hymenobacter sp.]